MARMLASIQRVVAVEAIPGADAIEKATVLGWECVVKKADGLRVGDLVVYIEIDAVCPPVEPFLFLADRKYRVRTIKLRGQVSQGLALPLRLFPALASGIEGQDVTAALGVVKHDPEAAREEKARAAMPVRHHPVRAWLLSFRWGRALHRRMFPEARRGWPEFIRKTDETRVQNLPEVLRSHAGKAFYATEKLDGQSASYFVTRTRGWFGWTTVTFGVCSRNLWLAVPHACTWWDVARALGVREILERVGQDICVQGEIVGPGVQGNKYRLSALRFYVFNVWDITRQRYYAYDECVRFCETYGFTMVPVLWDDRCLPSDVPSVVQLSEGTSVLTPGVLREGLVIRSMQNQPNGAPISFKVINPKFLLAHQDDEE